MQDYCIQLYMENGNSLSVVEMYNIKGDLDDNNNNLFSFESSKRLYFFRSHFDNCHRQNNNSSRLCSLMTLLSYPVSYI